jgi:hypothetical protein
MPSKDPYPDPAGPVDNWPPGSVYQDYGSADPVPELWFPFILNIRPSLSHLFVEVRKYVFPRSS